MFPEKSIRYLNKNVMLSIPIQFTPSPVKPESHVHIKHPTVLLQVALVWQGLLVLHSSISKIYENRTHMKKDALFN